MKRTKPILLVTARNESRALEIANLLGQCLLDPSLFPSEENKVYLRPTVADFSDSDIAKMKEFAKAASKLINAVSV